MVATLLACLLIGMLVGCSRLQLERPLHATPADWIMYGGDGCRSNVAHEILSPPLARAWEYDASAGFSPYSAAIVDSIVFVGDLHGDVQAISLQTGKRLGVHSFGSAIVGTPVLDHNTMYTVLDNETESVLAYDVYDGTIQWRARMGDVESSPLLIGQRLYVTTLNGKLACLKSSDGSTIWMYRSSPRTHAESVHSSPASDGTTIVFGDDGGGLHAVRADSGTPRWKAQCRGAIFATPSIADGRVFVGSLDSSFYALDLVDGKRVWATSLGARIFGSQAVAASRIFVGTAGRMVYCLDALDGHIVWKTPTGGIVNSAPLVSGNIVYVGCIDHTLYALDAASGEIRWEANAGGRIKTMPVASRGHLVVLAEDHSIIAFTPSAGQ